MKLENINKETWFKKRCLEYIPSHFVITRTAVTTETLFWVYERTNGRFAFVKHYPHADQQSLIYDEAIAFEDPKEAVMYELTWS